MLHVLQISLQLITRTIRSYTITNLTPMTNYMFSVVATNSIGSGEAGVLMITTPLGEQITPYMFLLRAGIYLVSYLLSTIKLVCVWAITYVHM